MLEVRHLKKEYKTKKGAVTKALDDVSLTFPETGMIFILGKSGSGKSTLLNVCGGLDRMDEGEIIIKGKSSNDFSAQDFDSYRNTYVGFVFQEYNILDEFTVEQNIALALELQNKKPDKEVIAKILEDVDLTDFANRKPNTMSGGQKQRVAIARALVKEPEIIMADEPTGALDSKTGQQVFDTLKKLSETKLVLIVSHDRDFAEQYGDRIIELKDGKIISDQLRAETQGEQNVKFYGTDTVCVASGSNLTDADLQSIKNFLAKSGGTAVISTSREKIAQFREDRPEISVGTFENIKEQPKSKQYEPQKMIRSHMPLKHAVKMGGSSLKTKPVRLAFTILLSVIAFVLFGLASTLMLFDGKTVTKSTLNDISDTHIILSKAYYETTRYYEGDTLDSEDERKQDTEFTLEEYEEFKNKYPGSLASVGVNINLGDSVRITQAADQFYSAYLDGVIITDSALTYEKGVAPQAMDEVAISDFILSMIMLNSTEFTYYSKAEDGDYMVGTQLKVTKAEDIIFDEENPGYLLISGKYYKVSGVYKGASIPSDYQDLKSAADQGTSYSGDYSDRFNWQDIRSNGMYNKLVVTEELAKQLAQSSSNSYFDFSKYFDNGQGSVSIGVKNSNDDVIGTSSAYLAKYDAADHPLLKVYDFDGNVITSLGAGQVALRYSHVARILNSIYSRYYNDLNWDEIYSAEGAAADEYRQGHPEPNKDDEQYDGDLAAFTAAHREWQNGMDAAQDAARANAAGQLKPYFLLLNQRKQEAYAAYDAENPEPTFQSDEWWDWDSRRSEAASNSSLPNVLSDIEYDRTYDRDVIFETLKTVYNAFEEMHLIDDLIAFGSYDNYESHVTIAGFMFEGDTYNTGIYLSDDIYNKYYIAYSDNWHSKTESKYRAPEDAFISAIYIPKTGSNVVNALVDMTYVRNADDSTYMIKNSAMDTLNMAIDMVDMLSLVFLILGLVLALFAFLLMFNFISASISAKKKEIGILRAIGARTVDVFKIFVSEALIIAAICFVASTLITFALCLVLNGLLIDSAMQISMFVFGPISVLAIFGIALLTAIISTVIPVGLYSRKPPIASIRAL